MTFKYFVRRCKLEWTINIEDVGPDLVSFIQYFCTWDGVNGGNSKIYSPWRMEMNEGSWGNTGQCWLWHSVRSSDQDTVTMSVSGVSWNVFVSGDQWWPVLTMWWLLQQCDDGGRWVVMISDNSRHLIRPRLSQHWSGYWQLITRRWALPLTLTWLLLCQTSIFQY